MKSVHRPPPPAVVRRTHADNAVVVVVVVVVCVCVCVWGAQTALGLRSAAAGSSSDKAEML